MDGKTAKRRMKQIQEANARYVKKACKSFAVRYNKTYDAEVIAWLEKQSNKADAIRQLVLREIAREKGEQR